MNKKSTKNKTVIRHNFPIVCIGASAGGLEAFKDFLKELPNNTGIAYIYVQHLDPHHKSVLVELLSRTTGIPIHQAKNNMKIKADNIYIFPPNKNMKVVKGALKLFPRPDPDGKYLPIDFFMRSLAEDRKNNAIGVILSGTASDGTIGLRAIKAGGGITFAQDNTAKYDSMPKSAIDAGYVDRVLSPAMIAKELVKIKKHPFTDLNIKENNDLLSDNKAEMGKIIALLQKETGTDFSHYKPGTIDRRINRRMILKKISKHSNYADYLKNNINELEELRKDILINVTNFFRDPPLFDAIISQVLPKLIRIKPATASIRIWVPGCSTGEEAYSMAICLLEYLDGKSINIPIQIFATDLNKDSIDKARSGVYSKSSIEGVSSKRLQRFFSKVGDRYQISKAVREMCVFATHDVTSDAPYSRIDLISCRNLLIYLDRDLQKKVISSFHYALMPKGCIVLGISETVGSLSDKFTLVNPKYKLFFKKSGSSTLFFKHTNGMNGGSAADLFLNKFNRNYSGNPIEFDLNKEADKILSKKYIPAGVLIDDSMKVVRFYGTTGPYIEQSSGEHFKNDRR